MELPSSHAVTELTCVCRYKEAGTCGTQRKVSLNYLLVYFSMFKGEVKSTWDRGLLGFCPEPLSEGPLWKGSRTFPVAEGSNTGSPLGTGMFMNSGGHPGVLESNISNAM